MKRYTQLTLNERENLFNMRNQNYTFLEIGKILGRSGSTISREYKRNLHSSSELGYLPDTANILAKGRKARHGTKISRYPHLKQLISGRMIEDRYSPEMIAGSLRGSEVSISTEAIYQYIYSKEGQKQKLYQHLMRARPKRNLYYGRKTRSNYGIKDRISITQRPIIQQGEFGHFEADLTFVKNSKKINLLTIAERKTGYLMAVLNDSKESENIAIKLIEKLVNVPRKYRKTITFDNGREFVMHNKLKEVIGINTYFCHPGSPWEKPYVENSHALLHRFIPKKTDAKTLTQEKVKNAIIKLNNLPRKRFGFKTPAQMFANEKFYQPDALRA